MTEYITRFVRDIRFNGPISNFLDHLESIKKKLEDIGCTSFFIEMVENFDGEEYYTALSMIGVRPETETEKIVRIKREANIAAREREREIGQLNYLLNKYKDLKN